MIRVKARSEPLEFHQRVREKGRKWLVEHPEGPLPAYWQGWCIEELRKAYKQICAYSGHRVQPITGASTVDHFIAKSLRRDLAYEWSNYRFVCALMNSRKRDYSQIPDPFLLPDGVFVLEPSLGWVRVGAVGTPEERAQFEEAITLLGLNDEGFVNYRIELYSDYLSGDLSFWGMARSAPFLAMELCRQQLLKPEDIEFKVEHVREWLDGD